MLVFIRRYITTIQQTSYNSTRKDIQMKAVIRRKHAFHTGVLQIIVPRLFNITLKS